MQQEPSPQVAAAKAVKSVTTAAQEQFGARAALVVLATQQGVRTLRELQLTPTEAIFVVESMAKVLLAAVEYAEGVQGREQR